MQSKLVYSIANYHLEKIEAARESFTEGQKLDGKIQLICRIL